MEMKFCSLSSGSSGNCQYIQTEKTKLLVDAGFSGKRIQELLKNINVCPTEINGIIVTHEHIDHIKGVGIMSRRFDIPIFANKKTWEEMNDKIGNIDEKNIKVIDNNEYFNYRDIDIKAINIFHDAIDPVGYILNYNNKKVSIVTDTGMIDDDLVGKIKDSDLYFLESNHDEFMLEMGLYPRHLKDRVASRHGHLSNRDAARTLTKLLKGNRENVILAHLSKDNNVPELAFDTVSNTLVEKGMNVKEEVNLGLSHRNKPTDFYIL